MGFLVSSGRESQLCSGHRSSGIAGPDGKVQRGARESQHRDHPAAIVLDLPKEREDHGPTKLQEGISMGDKSPKAKDKSRKQDAVDKNQKAQAAKAKMSPPAVSSGKKGK
jgi:hypothetical protein